MTLSEKQTIASVTRKLIILLRECDDEKFVDDIISCVQDGDDYSIRMKLLNEELY